MPISGWLRSESHSGCLWEAGHRIDTVHFMSLDEIDRLRHMHDAATAALTFAAHKERADLDSDLMFQFAIV
jgi:hypothetical protein